MSVTYTLGPTSETEVTIIPQWDLKKGEEIDRSVIRTRSGKLYTYKWHDVKKIKFSADLFDNSDAAIVNSWWDTQTKLIFFENIDDTVDCTSVMIMNNAAPFAQYTRPYITKFSGVIELEEYL